MLESGHILQLEATENFMRMEDGSNITLETGYHLIEESSEINWSASQFVGSGTDFQNELQCNLIQDAGDGSDFGLFILESESETSFLKLELSSGTEIVIDKEILVQEESEFITLESTERIIDEETNCIYGLDADLMILSMTLHVKNMYILISSPAFFTEVPAIPRPSNIEIYETISR